MNYSLLCGVMALLSGTAIAAEVELKTVTLPKKHYNVKTMNESYQHAEQIVGTIPLVEDASIVGAADEIKTDANGVTTLSGHARVDVTVGGKTVSTFRGPFESGKIVLVPWVDGKRPIDWPETNKFMLAFDEAFLARDPGKLAALFAPDARISVEEKSATGAAAKKMDKNEFAKFVQDLAPGSLKAERKYEQQSNDMPSYKMSEDGLTATISRRMTYQFTLPLGDFLFTANQTVAMARHQDSLIIASLAVTQPTEGDGRGRFRSPGR